MDERDEAAEVETDGETDGGPPFRLSGLDEFTPEYANFVHLNHDFYSFHLVFSRVVSPILVNDEDRARFAVEGWVADTVSRLVIPAPAFREMVQYMQQQVNAYDRQFGQTQDDSAISREEEAEVGS
jgi:hypothetical protein